MPGGKRRALKKLLQANQAASAPVPVSLSDSALDEPRSSSSPSNSLHAVVSPFPVPTTGSTSASSSSSPVPNSHSASSHVSAFPHGSAHSAHSSTPPTASVRPVSASAPPTTIPTPVAQAPPAQGGMYGGNNLWGAQRGRGGKKSSKQRFAERQARKTQAMLDSAPPSDPAWNAQLEKERQDEIRVIAGACAVLGREIFEIQPDGHCMFTAVADQLGQLGMLPAHQANNPYHTRRVAAQYMRDNQDDFLPFLASVDGEDMPGATDDGLMTPDQFKEYCHRVESTAEWGGEPEIQALCRAFGIPIHVIQRGPPAVVSHGGGDDTFGGAMTPEKSLAAGDRVVRISYHRRMYGLGEHYNSLRLVAP